ncbi:MAG TPA: BMP family ABC transporter substrate-binding protein [Gaiellaceae bacterium]|nr:BMP family ABC transporter substrate-binding protein [Gaiellaceae bacterium]
MKGTWKLAAAALAAAALGVALGLAGCGGDDESGSGTTGAATQGAADGSSVKVGLVTDVGQLNDRGFNQLAFEGVQQAKAELGIQYRVIESASDADYIPNMQSLADQGYDLIIGVGFAQGDAIATVAKEYPDTSFAIIDVDQSSLAGTPANVIGLLFQEEQVGYLAGVLAATVAKDEGADTISSVGGMKEPPVDRFIAGYQAGAKATVPEITVLNGYSQDWDDVAKCKEVALDQIARGSKIVFQVAGGCGLGALDAAKEKDVYGIGVDADQSFVGPQVLTSAMKRVDRAVFLTIKDVVDGAFAGGRNAVYGLEQDGVALGTMSPAVGADAKSAVEAARKQIVAGEISDIPREVSG